MKKASIFITVFMLLISAHAPVHAITQEDLKAINLGEPVYYGGDGASTCSNIDSEASSQVPTSFSLGEEPQERRINLMRALMADYSLSAEQVAGVVGNFMHESGGENLPPDVNEEGGEGPPEFSGGYGWAQWTGGRQEAFIDFAVENGYMENENQNATDAANYAYLKKELNEGYQVTITELKKQSSPEDAAISFEDTYEKAGQPNMEQRIEYAQQVFEEFDTSSGLTERQPGMCSTRPGSPAVIGDKAFPLVTSKSEIDNRHIFSDGTTQTGGHPYTAYDIVVPPGTPVAAFLSGTVTKISTDVCGGRFISIYNEESDITVSYLHLSLNNHVSEGDTVSEGDRVGLIGSEDQGCSVPHLHIDVAEGTSRPGCTRENCPSENQSQFVSIGEDLYETYQEVPE